MDNRHCTTSQLDTMRMATLTPYISKKLVVYCSRELQAFIKNPLIDEVMTG